MNIDLPTGDEIDANLAALPSLAFVWENQLNTAGQARLASLLRCAYRAGMDRGLQIAAQVVTNNQAAHS